MDLRMYLLVNKDVKIGKGKLAGQIGHAVMSYAYYRLKHLGTEDPLLARYMTHEQKKIVLFCPEERLLSLEAEGYLTIRDKGYTQLAPNTLTVVNLGVHAKDAVPEWVQGLKLVH